MSSNCQAPNCPREVSARGHCAAHYKQLIKGRPLTPIIPSKPAQHVRVTKYRKPNPEGELVRDLCFSGVCDREAVVGDLCRAHYTRQLRGRPLTPLQLKP